LADDVSVSGGHVAHVQVLGTLNRLATGAALLLLAPMAGLVAAQDRPSPVVELAAGWVGFADDGVVSEGLVGGAGRVYLSPRVSIGPELVYIQGANHTHVVLTGNVTWDVLAQRRGRPRRLVPFLVAGAGAFQTRESLFTGSFTSREGAFTAGGGVRVLTADRVTVGLDVRVGWEPHVRIGGVVGLHLRR
jgi:Outer membrane protein beta-barrel domain